MHLEEHTDSSPGFRLDVPLHNLLTNKLEMKNLQETSEGAADKAAAATTAAQGGATAKDDAKKNGSNVPPKST